MDRQLRVIKDGYLLAELIFNYQSQTTGFANITQYMPMPVTGGIYPVVPISTYQTGVEHAEFNSIFEIETFDRAFLAAQPTPPIPDGSGYVYELTADMEYVYDAVHYRYVLGNGSLIGIADIYADFMENTKALKFTSGQRINFDGNEPSDSIECNADLCKRFCETHFDLIPTTITRLGWHYM